MEQFRNQLSEGLGDLARGLKKLKACVDAIDISETGITINQVVRPERPQPKPRREHDPDAFVTEHVDNIKFLTEVPWTTHYEIKQAAMLASVGKTLRADKYKNSWLKDPEHKRGWRKISSPLFFKYFKRCSCLVDESSNVVTWAIERGDDSAEFNSTYNCLVNKKWDRRTVWQEIFLTYKEFRRYCVAVHEELPNLR